jgi:hypothetical protein
MIEYQNMPVQKRERQAQKPGHNNMPVQKTAARKPRLRRIAPAGFILCLFACLTLLSVIAGGGYP